LKHGEIVGTSKHTHRMTRLRSIPVTASLVLLVGSGLSLGLGDSVQAGGTAQGQLSRPAVAAGRVTFQARPLVVSSGTRVTLFGSVTGNRAGEDVKIQAKDCGLEFFRVVAGAVTEAGGTWSTFYSLPGPSTTMRAVWKDGTSAEIAIRKRATVRLRTQTAGRFDVFASGRSVWRKRVFIQRLDSRLGTWQAVKSVVLEESERGSARATFTVRLPKGTRIRAVFPRSQTGPCYLAGTSNTLTT
jgi:hypothetical protein